MRQTEPPSSRPFEDARSRRALNCAAFALLALYAWHASRYSFLCDDAYISFRYARNLVSGHGLVFNLGERVEGYTDFLWVLQLALLSVLGLPVPTAAILLSWLYTGLTFWVLARLCLQLRATAPAGLLFVGMLLFLAPHRSFAIWATGGLETRSFTFFVLLSMSLAWDALHSTHRAWQASLASAAACLTRPEGVLFFGCTALWWLAAATLTAKLSLRRLGALLGPCLAILGAHVLLRWLYYGELVPNTYFAKVVRPWPEMGLTYLTRAAIEYGVGLTAPLALLGLVAAAQAGRLPEASLATLLPAAQMAGLAYVGGDHFEYRPLDFVWPLLYLLTAAGLFRVHDLTHRMWPGSLSRWREPAADLAASAVTLLLLVYSIALPTLDTMEKASLSLEATSTVEKRVWRLARCLPFLDGLAETRKRLADASGGGHMVGLRQEWHARFAARMALLWDAYDGLAAEGVLPRSAVAADHAVGISAYRLDVTLIDELGLTDAVVSRHPPEPWSNDNAQRVIAHDRWPPPGYLEERGVNFLPGPVQWTRPALTSAGQYRYRLPDRRWIVFSSTRPEWVSHAFDPDRIESLAHESSRAGALHGTLGGPSQGE
jgi:arabinofuranosyltransferase